MSQRDKRALLIAGIAAAVFVAAQYLVLPLWDRMEEGREGLEVREQTFLKFREAVASKSAQEAEKELLEARLQDTEAEFLLSAESSAIASAELRTRVQRMAAENGMEAASIQFQAERPLGEDYVQVPLGIQLKGRIDNLVGFLKACGTGPTTLRVLGLSIQSLGDKEKTLNVNMTVAGILARARDGVDEAGRELMMRETRGERGGGVEEK